MFIPDPNFFHPGSRVENSIPDPDPHQRINVFLAQKNCFYALGNMIWIRILNFTHPGSKGQKRTGSLIRIRNTGKGLEVRGTVKLGKVILPGDLLDLVHVNAQLSKPIPQIFP
jgi:hypothetical protein